ncbi:MAG TPA: hypothetical protein GXX30_07025 [Firmicutes bacterium]|nr:hypothetical protein [Candidatus Fermentithermobacillaceae bacterium]
MAAHIGSGRRPWTFTREWGIRIEDQPPHVFGSGYQGIDRRILPDFPSGRSLETLTLHELGHSFVNPAMDMYSARVSGLGELFKPVERQMRDMAYPNVRYIEHPATGIQGSPISYPTFWAVSRNTRRNARRVGRAHYSIRQPVGSRKRRSLLQA